MSARIIPLHRTAAARPRGESAPPLPHSPPERIASQIEARLRDDRPDLFRSFVDGIRPIRRSTLAERMVEFFRHRGDLLVGLIAGTGFGCLLTAALALFIGGGGR
jgi:hypothetical protein